MSGDSPPAAFVDTNVFVYAVAADDSRRSPIAQELVKELMTSKVLHTSTQVLQELFVTLTRKVRKPFAAETALRYLDQIAALARGGSGLRCSENRRSAFVQQAPVVLGCSRHRGRRAVGLQTTLH